MFKLKSSKSLPHSAASPASAVVLEDGVASFGAAPKTPKGGRSFFKLSSLWSKLKHPNKKRMTKSHSLPAPPLSPMSTAVSESASQFDFDPFAKTISSDTVSSTTTNSSHDSVSSSSSPHQPCPPKEQWACPLPPVEEERQKNTQTQAPAPAITPAVTPAATMKSRSYSALSQEQRRRMAMEQCDRSLPLFPSRVKALTHGADSRVITKDFQLIKENISEMRQRNEEAAIKQAFGQ